MSKIKPISIVASISGKVCEHSDMYFRTNRQTGSVSTGMICNPSNASPSEAQKVAQVRFAKVRAAVQAIMADDEQCASYAKAFNAQHRIGSLSGYIFHKISPMYDKNGDLIAE